MLQNKIMPRHRYAGFLVDPHCKEKVPNVKSLPLITLIPQLNMEWKGYPSISFTLGHDTMHTVLNIDTFLRDIGQHRINSYGENLSFRHGIECFDSQSQAILHVFFNQFPQYQSHQSEASSSHEAPTFTRYNHCIQLEGDAFHQVIQLMMGRYMKVSALPTPVLVEMADPPINTQLSGIHEAFHSKKVKTNQLVLFGNSAQLYAISTEWLCSKWRKRESTCYGELSLF